MFTKEELQWLIAILELPMNGEKIEDARLRVSVYDKVRIEVEKLKDENRK